MLIVILFVIIILILFQRRKENAITRGVKVLKMVKFDPEDGKGQKATGEEAEAKGFGRGKKGSEKVDGGRISKFKTRFDYDFSKVDGDRIRKLEKLKKDIKILSDLEDNNETSRKKKYMKVASSLRK